MAFYLLQPDGVALSAGAHRRGRAGQHGGGSGRAVGGRSGFRPDTPADILKVNTTGWSLDPCSGWIDPGASTNQGMYGFAIDHSPTGTPTPPDATLPRKDIYYLQVNDSSAADGTSGTPSLTINYLAGTPASNPAAPTLPPRSFLLGTATVPQNGGGSPTVVMNPARYAAAGAPLPVYSQAERDALVLSDGLIVQRRDLPGDPLETYDIKSTKWTVSDVAWTNVPLAGGFDHWTTNGWSGMKYAVRNGWVILNGAVTKSTSWAGDATCGVMPAALKPSVRIQGSGVQVEPTAGNISLLAGGPGAVSFSATWPLF